MAFRLQSFIAGAATRASERLKTLEEDTKEVAKTEAGRIAQEIADARKQRIADTLDYNTTARKLKSQYGLNDTQVYSVLQGGLDQADSFMNTVRAGAIDAKTNNQEFDRDNYAQNLFTVKDYGDFTAPGLEQQASAYAASRSPVSAQSLVDQAASRVGVSTKTLLGQANPDYLKGLISQQVSASAGDMTPYEGPAFGTGLPEGAGFRAADVLPEDMLAIQQSQATIASTQAQTELTTAKTEETISLMSLKGEALEAEIASTVSRTGLNNVQASRITNLVGLEMREKEAGIELTNKNVEQIAKNMQFTDAKIGQLAVELGLTEAQTQLAYAKFDQALVQTDLLGVELANAPEVAAAKLAQIEAEIGLITNRSEELSIKNEALPDMLKAQLEETTANVFLKETQAQTSQLNGQKLEQEIFLNAEYGAAERQAALDLVEAKLITEQRFGDFEEYGTALLVRNDALRDAMRTETDPSVIAQMEQEIISNKERLVTVNGMTASSKGGDIFTESLNETTTFNTMLNKQATALDLDSTMGDLGQITMTLNESQLPKLFKATEQTIGQFNSQYGTYSRGRNHVIGEAQALNSAIRDFAMRNQQRSATADGDFARYNIPSVGAEVLGEGDPLNSEHYGTLNEGRPTTLTEAKSIANQQTNLKEGDTAAFKSNTGKDIFLVYSGGEWVGASY